MAVAAVLPYLYAASAVVGVASAVSSTQAQRANAQAQAAAADYNAKMQAQAAETARANAASEAERQQQQARQQLARQRVAAAESGFDPGYGSIAQEQQQSADNAALDAAMIRYRGELEARGYGAQSTLYGYNGSIARSNVGRAGTAGAIGAGSAILSGASSYYANSLRINGPGG